MSRERPENWDELDPDRRDYYYYDYDCIVWCELNSGAKAVTDGEDGLWETIDKLPPSNLLLVPTRQEWEETQQLNAEMLAMLEKHNKKWCMCCRWIAPTHHHNCELSALIKKARGV